jgi:hypothetical protein
VGSRLAKSGIDPKTLRSLDWKQCLLKLMQNGKDIRLQEIAGNFYRGLSNATGTTFMAVRRLNGLQILGLLDKFANAGAYTPSEFRAMLNKMFDREAWELATKKRYRMGANRR